MAVRRRHRRFIAVQVHEPLRRPEPGFDSILGSTTRLRNVAVEIRGQQGETTPADLGYQMLRTATSNLADVLRTPEETVQPELGAMAPSIKPDRSGEDLFFQVLLDWGLDLSLPLVREVIDGREVFSVDADALVACFAESVTPEVVKTMAARGPLRAVFRDDAFGSDAARINAEQVFREVSPTTEVRTI